MSAQFLSPFILTSSCSLFTCSLEFNCPFTSHFLSAISSDNDSSKSKSEGDKKIRRKRRAKVTRKSEEIGNKSSHGSSFSKKQGNDSDEMAEDLSGGQSRVNLGPFQLNQARNLITESPSRA